MYKYEIILYWRDEDLAFVAEVPEFSGCMARCDAREAAHRHVNRSGLTPRARSAIQYPNPRASV